MAAQPHWHQRLPAIREELAALETPTLDRAMIEQLFALSRRQAIRLMATIQKPRQGTANVVARERLLAALDRLLSTRPVQDAIARKRQLDEQLATFEREAQSRSAPIVPPPADPTRAWPHGVILTAPGVLTIGFNSAEELLGRVLALTEGAAADYAAFKSCVETGREESAR